MSSSRRRAELEREATAIAEQRNADEYARLKKSWFTLIEDADNIYEIKRILHEMAEHLPERGAT